MICGQLVLRSKPGPLAFAGLGAAAWIQGISMFLKGFTPQGSQIATLKELQAPLYRSQCLILGVLPTAWHHPQYQLWKAQQLKEGAFGCIRTICLDGTAQGLRDVPLSAIGRMAQGGHPGS
jgi:hypothetical protein